LKVVGLYFFSMGFGNKKPLGFGMGFNPETLMLWSDFRKLGRKSQGFQPQTAMKFWPRNIIFQSHVSRRFVEDINLNNQKTGIWWNFYWCFFTFSWRSMKRVGCWKLLISFW
jgi:hypothetical protein